MPQPKSTISRRRFLTTAAKASAVFAVPTLVPGRVLGLDGGVAASERITLAGLGIGGRGGYVLGVMMEEPVFQFVAIADPQKARREGVKQRTEQKYGPGVEMYRDFREMLPREDIDAVLTTREFSRLLDLFGIDFRSLPESEFDYVLGGPTGSGDIFAASGGVMESALRTAYHLLTGGTLLLPPEVDEVRELNRIATGGLVPDLTLLLDVDPAAGLEQATAAGADRLEAAGLEFHERVRAGYLEIAAAEPGRVKLIHRGGVDEVAREVWLHVEPLLGGATP